MEMLERETLTTAAPAVVLCSCGTVPAPDGTCLEIGTCLEADLAATRGAARETAKHRVPAAWSASGRVD